MSADLVGHAFQARQVKFRRAKTAAARRYIFANCAVAPSALPRSRATPVTWAP
jgi:hypothetical protein